MPNPPVQTLGSPAEEPHWFSPAALKQLRFLGCEPLTSTRGLATIVRLATDAPSLDIGCGLNKRPGSIGIDRNPHAAADVLADIDKHGLPFRDSTFGSVSLVHVIEHVADVVATMEEVHRVLLPRGRLLIETPHYSDASSFADPTHRWHLSSFSFRYFTEHGGFSYYSECRFRQVQLKVKLLRLWRLLGFEIAVNRFRAVRKFWEYYLCFLVRGKVLIFELEAIK